MEHVPTKPFYRLQSEVNNLLESINQWLVDNPNRRNLFIKRLSILFEKKSLEYACLGAAIWTGPNLYQSVDLLDGFYCYRAAEILLVLCELLNAALPEFQIQKMEGFPSPKGFLVCEKWLYEAVSEANQKVTSVQFCTEETVEGQFAALLAGVNVKRDLRSQAAKKDYSRECPVCQELSLLYNC